MAVTAAAELQKIKGIGRMLSQRLLAAGVDSHSKLVDLGEEGLRQLPGIQPRTIPAILAQAAELAAAASAGAQARQQALAEHCGRLGEQVRELAAGHRERAGEPLEERAGKRFDKQVRKLLGGLERAAGQAGERTRRVTKSLAKVEKRLDALAGEDLKGLTRALKKARKPLKRFKA